MNGISLNTESGIGPLDEYSNVPEKELNYFGQLAKPFIVENTVLENNAALVLSPRLEIEDMDPALTPMDCGYYYFIRLKEYPNKRDYRTVFNLIWQDHQSQMLRDASTSSQENLTGMFDRFSHRE